METYLKENPQFLETAALMEKIRDKTILSEIKSIEGHLVVIDMNTIRALIEYNRTHKSTEMRTALRKIAEKESEGVESMIYRMLSHKPIEFEDFNLKLAFYKEFGEFRKLFRNKKENAKFIMGDLLFRKINYNEDINEEVQILIDQMEILDKIFYFMIFGRYFDGKYIVEFSRSLQELQPSDLFLKYRIMALSQLSEDDYYSHVAPILLYSSDAQKIKILRFFDDQFDYQKLSLALMDACFSSKMGIDKVYTIYLRLMELFSLKYKFRLKILYSWMRYFLKEGFIDLFCDLADRMRNAKHIGNEYEFYKVFYSVLKKQASMDELYQMLDDVEDRNECARHSLREILKIYTVRV